MIRRNTTESKQQGMNIKKISHIVNVKDIFRREKIKNKWLLFEGYIVLFN